MKRLFFRFGGVGLLAVLLSVSLSTLAIAAPVAQPLTCAETYIVQANDWLSKIADKFLGDIEAYPALVAATNQRRQTDHSFSQILDPDQIEIGWKLCVPANPAAEALLAVEPPLTAAPLPVAVETNEPVDGATLYTLDNFAAEFHFGPEIDPAWLYNSPERLKQRAASAEYQQRFDQYGYRANYLWNENLENDYLLYAGIFRETPSDIKLFAAPWGSGSPRYRYPPKVTLPSGITTNQFGWRGPNLALKKPAKTIRIACVGASTTVSGHTFPHSYPEFLQHWLNLWSEENDYDLKFEVINAGREGLSSHDIAAVVRYEVIPLDVDYVIYYEGANQFNVNSMVTYPSEETFGEPPAGLVPNLANVESEDKTLLDQLSEVSALAARARSVVEQFSLTGKEPPKPEQQFHLPQDLDEFRPERERLGNALELRKVLRDLDEIKDALDKRDVKFLLATFDWFVYDDMVLNPARHRNLYIYLNRVYWPISYANMRRMADFQNRVFESWAAQNGVNVIDVAGQMPRHPDLYDDAIHNRPLGIQIRAWLNFEALVPLLKQDIENGALPRRRRVFYSKHPYLTGEYYTRRLVD